MSAADSAHDFTMTSIKGQPVSLKDFKGKPVLFVNVASQCGYTPQYKGLEALYRKYKDQGLVIVGVPANNFGAQEPGSNDEIATFCKRNYDVTFPMMSKVDVKGASMTPLYRWRRQMELHQVSGRQGWQNHSTLRVRRRSAVGRAHRRHRKSFEVNRPLLPAGAEH
jgi:glutathione peroxidase-family protein